jgi:hypothetical protein
MCLDVKNSAHVEKWINGLWFFTRNVGEVAEKFGF